MKKFLSIVLAIVMVLSLAVTVFAGKNSNLTLAGEGAEKTYSATPLNAMYAAGILKGDGVKAPSSSAALTRWQVALIALRAYSLVDVEDGAATYNFDDAAWTNFVSDLSKEIAYEDCEYPEALGAILLVQEKGFIRGYVEDGKTYFKPEQNVTYAEALTVMVRILGWDSEEMNENWPYNYVAKAAELGLTENITKIGMDDQVTYGVMAQLVYNVLNANRFVPDILLAPQYQDVLVSSAENGFEISAVGGDEVMSELAASTFIFAWIKADGSVEQITLKDNDDSFTFLNNTGRFGQYVADKNGNGGAKFDLGYFSNDDEEGYAVKNYTTKVYVQGANIMGSGSDFRVRNWFWYFYNYEIVDGEIVLDKTTRTAALTHNQNRNENGYSNNAWYMQKVGSGNVAMVYEPMSKDEDLLVINVNGDIYLAHVDAEAVAAYWDAFEAAYNEYMDGAVDAILADEEAMNVVKTAALVYYRQGTYYGGGNWSGDPNVGLDEGIWGDRNAHINAWSLNAVLDLMGIGYMAIDAGENAELNAIAQYNFQSESGPWVTAWEDEGLDGLVQNNFSVKNVKQLFDLSHDWGYYFYEDLVKNETELLEWTAAKYASVKSAADAEAAGFAAAKEAAAEMLDGALGSINTDVEGETFIGWSNLVWIGDEDNETKLKFTINGDEESVYVKTLAINALYAEDATTLEWVGEENTLGAYVVETAVKEGFTYVTEYARKLVTMSELNEKELNAEVTYVGIKNEATFGAWLIDTNGDGLFDVAVYANFVTVLAD